MTASPPPLFVIAGLLATRHPQAWQRLLTDHVADHTGHCRTCRLTSGAAPVWPCRLAIIADETQRLTVAARRTP